MNILTTLLRTTRIKRTQDISNPKEDKGLLCLMIVMAVGVGAICCLAINAWPNFTAVLALALGAALAATVAGGIMGFIFGIPRSLQKEDVTKAETGNNGNTVYYGGNTNLEQISDWVTKIIVGISLTQYKAIEQRFDTVASNLAKGLDYYINKKEVTGNETDFTLAFASCLLIFYSICGFLLVYHWARIYLLLQLDSISKSLFLSKVEETKNLAQDAKAMAKENLKSTLQNKLDEVLRRIKELNLQRTRVENVENERRQDKRAQLISLFKPEIVAVLNDSQKNRWGGNPVSSGYILGAVFNCIPDNESLFNIKVFVKREPESTEKPIKEVFFFLDQTFKEFIRREKFDVATGEAFTTFTTYEAFTVGAVVIEDDNGTDRYIKLELDLNFHKDAPKAFTYNETLFTIEDLIKERNDIHEELKKINDENSE